MYSFEADFLFSVNIRFTSESTICLPALTINVAANTLLIYSTQPTNKFVFTCYLYMFDLDLSMGACKSHSENVFLTSLTVACGAIQIWHLLISWSQFLIVVIHSTKSWIMSASIHITMRRLKRLVCSFNNFWWRVSFIHKTKAANSESVRFTQVIYCEQRRPDWLK